MVAQEAPCARIEACLSRLTSPASHPSGPGAGVIVGTIELTVEATLPAGMLAAVLSAVACIAVPDSLVVFGAGLNGVKLLEAVAEEAKYVSIASPSWAQNSPY